MDIVFVIPYVPNLIRTRSYNLIRGLSARGHRVTVLTLWTSEQDRRDADRLREHCHAVQALPLPRWRSAWNCARTLPSAEPLQAAYCWQPALLPVLEAEASRAQVVHVEHLRGVRYGLHLRDWLARRGLPAPVVWDSVDSISLLFRQAATRSRSAFGRWVTQFELARTERYEGRLLRQFERVLTTSAADKHALASLAGEPPETERVVVLPNGVDVDYFAPNGDSRDAATLVFSGKMSYHANVTMALHLVQTLMPLVWAKRPDVKVQIVGKDPPREVLRLGRNPAVTVTGTVPDIRTYLNRATVAVVPLVYGAGSQFKVLEAMACGTPVVTTPQAAAPYQVQPGRDLLVAGTPDEFASHVTQLLDDPGRRRAMGQAGRRYAETYHRWDRLAAGLEDVYASLVQARRERPLAGGMPMVV
jgi:sugar transferase (PEP-CTERM/EpsH1 system associated)